MKSVISAAAALLSLAAAGPAAAALPVGAAAPQFAIAGTQGKAGTTVDLSELLRRGPVVIFFVPSAFTDAPACRDFAAHFDQFHAAGVTLIGMSRDTLDTLAQFSTEECGGKFPMAGAAESLVNDFDVNDGAMFNTRTTYVIAPSGKIVFVNDDPEYNSHARSALAFVQGMNK